MYISNKRPRNRTRNNLSGGRKISLHLGDQDTKSTSTQKTKTIGNYLAAWNIKVNITKTWRNKMLPKINLFSSGRIYFIGTGWALKRDNKT